jgi:hypothetical protein
MPPEHRLSVATEQPSHPRFGSKESPETWVCDLARTTPADGLKLQAVDQPRPARLCCSDPGDDLVEGAAVAAVQREPAEHEDEPNN